MNDMKRTILAAVVLLIAEAFIVCAMLLIPAPIPMRVRILDIVVLSVILWTAGYDLFRPIVSLGSGHPREIGSLGVRWTGQIVYMLLAVGLGVAGVVYSVTFVYQLLGQSLLIALLLLVWFFASHSAAMVEKVAEKEDTALAGRELMRMALSQIQDRAVGTALPDYFNAAVRNMEDRLRYISPCSSPDAVSLERQFTDTAERVCAAMADFRVNEETVRQNLQLMQHILDNRKKVRN